MATSLVVLARSRAGAQVAPRAKSSGAGTPSGDRTGEVWTVEERNGGAVASDATTVDMSNARSLRALPLSLLHTSSWADQVTVRLNSGEVRALLNALRAN